MPSDAIIKKPCGGCLEEFRLDCRTMTVTMRVPSNGLRGAKHVPEHTVTAEGTLSHDGILIQWDCPRCGYADSEYDDDAMRRELGSA